MYDQYPEGPLPRGALAPLAPVDNESEESSSNDDDDSWGENSPGEEDAPDHDHDEEDEVLGDAPVGDVEEEVVGTTEGAGEAPADPVPGDNWSDFSGF